MQKILEKVKTCSVPLSRPQDFHDILATLDTTTTTTTAICKPAVSIFDKLEELYREECFKELQNGNNVRQTDTLLCDSCCIKLLFVQSVKTNSFLLEKLVTRERLNTLILNLYPEKNEYSVSLRMGSIVDDINIGNNIDKASNVSI